MYKKSLLAALISLSVFNFANRVVAQSETIIGEIKKILSCTCECKMTVDACEGSMNCQSANKIKSELEKLIQKGFDKNQIIASFVTQYGEHILSIPSKKGFNLIAWLLPFISIFIAGFIIIVVVRRWVARAQGDNDIEIIRNDSAIIDAAYNKKLEDILRILEE